MITGLQTFVAEAFSPFLIAVGQTLAMLTFLSGNHLAALWEKKRRIAAALAFFLLSGLLQTALRMAITSQNQAPMLLYLCISLVVDIGFAAVWSEMPQAVSVFAGLLFLVADNCVWPLLGSLSSMTLGVNYLISGPLICRVPMIALFWALEYGIMRLIDALLPPRRDVRITRYMGVMMIAAIIPFFYIRVLSSRMPVQDNKSFQIVMTICFLVQMIMLVRGVRETSDEQTKMEILRMQNVLDKQQQQFSQKLQNIDAINRKYHDMKNMLLCLQAEQPGQGEGKQMIRELLAEIKPYEALVTTGSQVIDIILSEKLQICHEKEISCVPYVDGRLLSFVDPLDLCTLFGNALDNAIEGCQGMEDPELRQISLKTAERGGTVVLTFRNTYEKEPQLKAGLPQSTKGDSENHGFGLKNIQYVMKKYHGQMSCRVENGEFVLTLLFLREP